MDCANAVSLSAGHSGRVVEVQWDDDSGGTFMAAIEVRAIDRSGLLVDVTRILTEGGVSIDRCSTHTSDDRVSTLYFEFELGDAGHLGTILSRLRGLTRCITLIERRSALDCRQSCRAIRRGCSQRLFARVFSVASAAAVLESSSGIELLRVAE